MWKRTPVAALVMLLLLMGFDKNTADQALHGQWQTRAGRAAAMSIDTTKGEVTFVDQGRRCSSPFLIEEVIGRAVKAKICESTYFLHLDSDQQTFEMAAEGEDTLWLFERVE